MPKPIYLALTILLFTSTGCSEPFVSIGAVKKEFTDAVCTMEYKKKFIFIDYYPDPKNEFWVNVDGQDIQLTFVRKIDDDSFQYKAKDLTVIVDYGPAKEESPDKIGMDVTFYPKAKITFKKENKIYSLKVEGACS
jgi:hypothetical protein